jgi:hypothetical protein
MKRRNDGKWERVCPNCAHVIITEQWSNSELCRSCSRKTVIREDGKFTVKYHIEKLVRECPSCHNTITYKLKDSLLRADRKHSLCRSCMSIKRNTTNKN